jgi:hypothetical protein
MTDTLNFGYSAPTRLRQLEKLESGNSGSHRIATMTDTFDSGYSGFHKTATMRDTFDSGYSGSHKTATVTVTDLEALLTHNSYLQALLLH